MSKRQKETGKVWKSLEKKIQKAFMAQLHAGNMKIVSYRMLRKTCIRDSDCSKSKQYTCFYSLNNLFSYHLTHETEMAKC